MAAITYAEVVAMKKEVESDYHNKHTALRNLRRYWQGDFWRLADSESHPIATIFRDWTQRTSDVGPDVKLVKNVVQQVCVKYQTYLSQLPQIRVYVDPPESDTKRGQATLKERYLYGLWSEGNMNRELTNMSWYLPLMGGVYQGIWPNMDKGMPTPVLRSCEYAFPIMSFDGNRENATIFSWKTTQQKALQNFPNYVPPDEQYKSTKVLGRLRKRPNNDKGDAAGAVEIIEFSDNTQYQLFVDDQLVKGIEHNFNWNLFEHIKFINVPGEPFGHGAVEQAVNLNEMGNALYSILFQSVIENAFPALVLEDPQKAPEEIEKGAGAVIPLNPGGKAYYLTPPVQALPVQQQFLHSNEHDIRQASGMGDTEFGQSPASSIVTGKAVDALTGAGSGNTIEMVQGTGIGPGLVAWNEKAIRLGQTIFRDKTMNLYGRETPGAFEMQGRGFSMRVKGSQLIGSTRNEVAFAVALGQHEKLVMGLQALGANLVSKKYVREQIGVVDNAHMIEEILVENVDDAVFGAMTAALQTAATTPEQAQQIEEQGTTFLEGGSNPHPLIGAPTGGPPLAPPTGPGGPQAAPPGGGTPPPGLPATAPPNGPPLPGIPGGSGLPAPTGPPTTPAGTPGPTGGGPNVVTLEQAQSAFQTLQGLQGEVYLIGQIVQEGQTDGDIGVAITVPTDKPTITAGLPQYAGKLSFHVVTKEPVEPHVNVTPGPNSGQAGGSNEALAGLLNG